MAAVSARRCCVCGRPKGVTFHAWQVGTAMRSLPTHLRCMLRLQRGQATIRYPELIPVRQS